MRLRSLIAAVILTIAQSSGAETVKLNSIAHVAFRVSDLEKATQFYARLGFESPFHFTDEGKVTEVFVKVNDDQFVELYPRAEPSQKLGLMHVCFGTDDIESVRQEFVHRGLNPPEAKKGRAGNVLFAIHDPESQLVEFSQYMPDSLHWLDRGKHLGDRIATQLQKVTEPVKDAPSEYAFYSTKLGLGKASQSSALRLPQNPGEELAFKSASAEPAARIYFLVEDVKRTRKALKQRGFNPRLEHGAIILRDPDGNEVAFRTVQSSK